MCLWCSMELKFGAQYFMVCNEKTLKNFCIFVHGMFFAHLLAHRTKLIKDQTMKFSIQIHSHFNFLQILSVLHFKIPHVNSWKEFFVEIRGPKGHVGPLGRKNLIVISIYLSIYLQDRLHPLSPAVSHQIDIKRKRRKGMMPCVSIPTRKTPSCMNLATA